MGYGVPDTVRLLLSEITDTIASDEEIDSYSEDVIDPEINALLASYDAPWSPVTAAPAIVRMIASRWVAAEIVNARVHEDDAESEWAAAMRRRGQDLIDKILDGTIAIATPEETAGSKDKILVSDLTDAYPSHTVFVSTDSYNWRDRCEERE